MRLPWLPAEGTGGLLIEQTSQIRCTLGNGSQVLFGRIEAWTPAGEVSATDEYLEQGYEW